MIATWGPGQDVCWPAPLPSLAEFGSALALRGSRAIVGAAPASAAYVYRRDGVEWFQEGAFSPDGPLPAATTEASKVQLIEVSRGRSVATLSTNDDPASVRWLAFSPDGSQLAVCYAGDGLRIWDVSQLRSVLRRIDLDW